MQNNIIDYLFFRNLSCFNLFQKIKILIQIILGIILDVVVLPVILMVCLYVRYGKKNQRKKIFIGCFPNNNLVQVAEALKTKNYSVTYVPFFIPLHEKGIIKYDIDLESSFPITYKNWLGNRLLNYGLFIWAILKFEVFIMPFLNRLLDRTPLLQWLEFQFLRFSRKLIILNPYAADIYTPKLTLSSRKNITVLQDYQTDPFYSTINENYILKARHYGEKYAHKVIAALDLVDYLNRVDHLLQMRCLNTKNIRPFYRTNNKIFKVVHAPNHRSLKGTKYLIEATERLKKEGINVDLEIIEKQTNAYVLEKISQADCVADQFLMGAYGRLAIESMVYGKPVLCYLRDDLKKIYPHWSNSAIINTSIYTIYDNLKMLIQMDKEQRIAIGKKSREYIEQFHSYNFIANEMDKIIRSIQDDSNR